MLKRLLFLLCLCSGCLYGETDSSGIKTVDAMIEQFYDATYKNPDSALRILDAADSLAKKINYRQGITSALRQRGIFYNERSEYVKSLEMLFSALKQDEEMVNNDGIAMDLLFIGLNYFQQEKMEESLKSMKKALQIYTNIKDEAGIALINANMGMVYRNSNRFEDALNCYTRVKNYYLKSGNTGNLSRVENNIGNVYKDLKQYDKALEHYLVAKELKEKENDQYGLVISYSNLADVYVQKRDFKQAFELYAKALKIAEEQKSVSLVKDVYFDLSDAYSQNGDYKKAYECFKRSTALKDSIVSEKYNKDIADMKVKYDSDKKENENVVLKKDNELQEIKIRDERNQKIVFVVLFLVVFVVVVLVFRQYRQKKQLNEQLEKINEKVNKQNTTLRTLNAELIESEESLTAANATKDQLISMLSHDLYNPVTSVINYTNLVVAKQNVSPEELYTSFRKVNAAVVPLQDLLDNILQWARIQKKNIDPLYEMVDLKKVTEEIIQLYQPAASFKEIAIRTSFSGKIMIHSDRLMTYFILRNILNNAVKFCSANKEIRISAKEETDKVVVLIADQGNGFSESVLLRLNSQLKQDETISEQGSGIGLSVSRQFVQQLGWKIKFLNSAEGASVEMVIPLSASHA